MKTYSIPQIRALLGKKFGARNYTITGADRGQFVYVYGVMPNTNETGWYMYGYVDSEEMIQRLTNGNHQKGTSCH